VQVAEVCRVPGYSLAAPSGPPEVFESVILTQRASSKQSGFLSSR